jgi:hypothetical protein
MLEEYGLSRSFRRGAKLEARSHGVAAEDVDLTNRWPTFEGARGHLRLTMHDHNLDIHLMIPAPLRFSEIL